MARTKATPPNSDKKQPKGPKKSIKTKSIKPTTAEDIKKPKTRRFKPGTVANREVNRYRKSVELLIPRKSMETLARELIYDFSPDSRIQKEAMKAIHTASEDLMTDIFERTRELLCLSDRKTITQKGVRFASAYYLKELPAYVDTKRVSQ